MRLFVLVSWVLCVATSLLLWVVIWRQRFLLVKPSMIVIVLFHLRVQWAATIYSASIESYLPDAWTFGLLSHGFPLIGLGGSFLIGRKSAWIIWKQVVNFGGSSLKVERRAIVVLAGAIGIFTALYLRYIPFSSTGLYAIFTDPTGSAVAREYSLKIVESGFIKYGFNFVASGLAPLLSVLLLFDKCGDFSRWRCGTASVKIVILIGLLFSVSLTGARGFGAFIIFTMMFALFLKRGIPLKLSYVALGCMSTVSIPILLTMFREGKVLSIGSFMSYFVGGIWRRVFETPMETGLYFTHFAQTEGFLGIGGIPKLATLFDIAPVNAANYLGLIYFGTSIESISMNTSYVYAYYCYFGIVSLGISVVCLWLLDVALLVYRKLRMPILLACVAAGSAASTSLISSQYTTLLLSNGFGIVLLGSIGLDRLCRLSVRGKNANGKYTRTG